jgi:hypothetical protein
MSEHGYSAAHAAGPAREASMSTWIRIATSTFAGPVCIAVTVIGLVLSYYAWRRKGVRSAMRGVAWSLLPTVAWLTNSVHLIGNIGSAIVQFAQGFAFSPKTWLGVILICVAVVLFLVSGGIPLLQRGGGRQRKAAERTKSANKPQDKQAKKDAQGTAIAPAAKGGQAAAAGDDDLSDVEDILRKHGIK